MKPLSILIVEDETVVAFELRLWLKRIGFPEVHIACTGAQAIEFAEKILLDVILMDIRLKGQMTGIEAAEKIHKFRAIPIVYISGNTDLSSDPRLAATEPIAFLPKPISDDDLLTILTRMAS